jgi:hypothetical protein
MRNRGIPRPFPRFEIPMTSSNPESYVPPAVRRVATAFRLAGWVGFWVQIVLGIISALVLLFATTSLSVRSGTASNPGTGAGLLFAVVGVGVLFGGAYWSFRYTRLSRQLRSANAKVRPKRGDAIQAVRIGLIINLVGMLITLIGAQAIVGSLLAKSLAQPQGGAIYNPGQLREFIQSLDIFIVQANTNTVTAHFAGVLASLWLVRSLNRQ